VRPPGAARRGRDTSVALTGTTSCGWISRHGVVGPERQSSPPPRSTGGRGRWAESGRSRVRPEQAGIPAGPDRRPNRRLAGLRAKRSSCWLESAPATTACGWSAGATRTAYGSGQRAILSGSPAGRPVLGRAGSGAAGRGPRRAAPRRLVATGRSRRAVGGHLGALRKRGGEDGRSGRHLSVRTPRGHDHARPDRRGGHPAGTSRPHGHPGVPTLTLMVGMPRDGPVVLGATGRD